MHLSREAREVPPLPEAREMPPLPDSMAFQVENPVVNLQAGGMKGPVWQRPGRLPCAVTFTEPAKGQEAKFSKSCQGYANFTGQNQGAMDAVRPRSLPPLSLLHS